MSWNWTHPHWPNFQYDPASLASLEQRFLLASGELIGAVRYVSREEQDILHV